MNIMEQYRAAVQAAKEYPEGRQQSAILGMGFLIGAGMFGAAAALVDLYVREYGHESLPDMIKELERQ
jgi:hypothetical protein